MSNCCRKYTNKTFWNVQTSSKRIVYIFCPECGDRLQHGRKFKPHRTNMSKKVPWIKAFLQNEIAKYKHF